MFWYGLVLVLRALWAVLVVLLVAVLLMAMLAAACVRAGGEGLPQGALGCCVVELVGEHVRALRNSLPPTTQE